MTVNSWGQRLFGYGRTLCGYSVESQGLVEMRVIKYVPEPTDDLTISPRMIRKDTLRCSQRKYGKRVAAALQRRLYGGRTHEIAESHNRRGIGQAVGGRQILPQQTLRHLDGIDNYAIRTHESETRKELERSADVRTPQSSTRSTSTFTHSPISHR